MHVWLDGPARSNFRARRPSGDVARHMHQPPNSWNAAHDDIGCARDCAVAAATRFAFRAGRRAAEVPLYEAAVERNEEVRRLVVIDRPQARDHRRNARRKECSGERRRSFRGRQLSVAGAASGENHRASFSATAIERSLMRTPRRCCARPTRARDGIVAARRVRPRRARRNAGCRTAEPFARRRRRSPRAPTTGFW